MNGGARGEAGDDFEELRDRLRALGRVPAPDPSPGFADRLERHLRTLHLARGHSPVGPSDGGKPATGPGSPLRPRVRGRTGSAGRGGVRGPRRRRWPTTLVAAAFSAAAVMLGVGSLRGSTPEVRVSAANETVVLMPGGAVVEARPGLVVPEGAVLEVGPGGSVRFGDMSLGPGQRAIVDDGGLRIGRTGGGDVAALLGEDGGAVATIDSPVGDPPSTRQGASGREPAMVTTTIAVEPTAVTTEVSPATTLPLAVPPDPDSSSTSEAPAAGDQPTGGEPQGDIGTASSQVREPDPVPTTEAAAPTDPLSRTESATTTTSSVPAPAETPTVDPVDSGDGQPDGEAGLLSGEGNQPEDDSGAEGSLPPPCPTTGTDEGPSTTDPDGFPSTSTQVTVTEADPTTTLPGSSSTAATTGSQSPAPTSTAPVGSTTSTTYPVPDPSGTSVPDHLLANMTTEGTGDCLPPEVESVIQAVEDILTAVP